MAMEIRRVICGPNDTPAHDQPILCVAYNPQRREISTGSQDTTIKTWLSETGEHVRTLQEHKGWVTGLAFSPELRVLFSCSVDGRVLVWNKAELIQKEKVGSGKGADSEIAGAAVKGGPLHCLAWDARRHSLVVGANGHIWVYAAIPETEMSPSARVIIRLQSLLKDAHAALGPENALVRGIISTVTGKIFSVGYDRRLCMWDTDSTRAVGGKKKAKKGDADTGPIQREPPKLRQMGDGPVECHDGAISAVAFDPHNNWVITGSYDRQVKIWAGDSKKPVAIIDEKNGIDDTVSGLAYCPATKTLWMSSNSSHPLVYDPRSATDITPFLQQSDATKGEREAKERIQRLFRIEQTGELLGSTTTRNLLIWRFNPNGAAAILRAHTDWAEVLAHCYKRQPTQDGKDEGEEDSMVLFSGGADSLIRRWEPASRMNPYIYAHTEALPGHTGAVLCALYCEAVDMFVTGGDDSTLRLWPLDDNPEDDKNGGRKGSGAKPNAPSQPQASQPPMVLREHTDRVTGLISYGSTIGSVSWDLSIRLWDVHAALRDMRNLEEPKSTHVINDAHDDYVLSMAHAPELEQIASASADQGVKLWDLREDTEPSEGGVDADGTRLLFVPEGRRGKKLCGTLTGHAADVSHVKWNTVHGLWVTGSEDHTVRCWTPDGVQLYEIRPPGDAVTALAIDANGYILCASMDCSVRVYDVETQEVVQQHNGHSDAVRCVIHVPQKQQYLTASWDRTIRVWRAYAPPVKQQELLDSEDEGAPAATEVAGTATGGEADDGPAEEEEEEFVPYSVKFPLIEPKCLADRGKGSGDKFMRKVTKEESGKARAKKGEGLDDALTAKPPQGLAAELNKLEERLKHELKADSTEPRGGGATDRRGRGRQGGMAQAGRAPGRATAR